MEIAEEGGTGDACTLRGLHDRDSLRTCSKTQETLLRNQIACTSGAFLQQAQQQFRLVSHMQLHFPEPWTPSPRKQLLRTVQEKIQD